MSQRLSDSRLANVGAKRIHEAFRTYRTHFQAITHRAELRFVEQDWAGMTADAAERLQLYHRVITLIEAFLRDLMGDRVGDKAIWTGMKAVYSGLIDQTDDWELAETFFNSVTRRIFVTVGVDRLIEFVDTDFETPPTASGRPLTRAYQRTGTGADLVHRILMDYPFADRYRDAAGDARLVSDRLETELGVPVERIDMIRAPFYRGMGVYLIGRLVHDGRRRPLVLALIHAPDGGVIVDAVLTDESSLSILFSFAHSYFHVEAPRPYDLVSFLRDLMPRKRVGELYISLGYNKHGKTELYRDLLHHLEFTSDCFERARGQRGMVMLVFTMPGYDMVLKLIKDHFNYPKDSTRKEVMAKYDLVYRRDRAGRLIDAQSFEFLQFKRDRFQPELLEELARDASQTVTITDDKVIIAHAYLMRRVTPLDIYLREATAEEACAAVIDYGQSIKDMATNNIFPGDMLLKNFGVTRHGRVVFYDYDELCLLTDCTFRPVPPARHDEDEFSAEPWYHVRAGDIFPEQFPHFLGLPRPLREVFDAHHADLYSAGYWRAQQEAAARGSLAHIFPYRPSQRLHNQETN
jgi:isocitrate dehydrogenase kinase/phosphatase